MAKPKTKTTAAQLIAKRQASRTGLLAPPSATALEELRTIVEYNDTSDRMTKVTIDAAIELLREHGWNGRSRQALNAVCARHLGRFSYARA